MTLTKLFDVVHVLLQLSYSDGELSTEILARSIGVTPSEIGPILFELFAAGLVNFSSDGEYWSLERTLNEVSLLDIYEGFGRIDPSPISMQSSSRNYLIRHNLPAVITELRSAMQYLILGRLEGITLEDLKLSGKNGRN